MSRTPHIAFSFTAAAIVLSATMTVFLQSSPTRAATEAPAVGIAVSSRSLSLACNTQTYDICRNNTCGARPPSGRGALLTRLMDWERCMARCRTINRC